MTFKVMLGRHNSSVLFLFMQCVFILLSSFLVVKQMMMLCFRVTFTPTVEHCSMATIIGLCLRVKLLRSLPSRYKVSALFAYLLTLLLMGFICLTGETYYGISELHTYVSV